MAISETTLTDAIDLFLDGITNINNATATGALYRSNVLGAKSAIFNYEAARLSTDSNMKNPMLSFWHPGWVNNGYGMSSQYTGSPVSTTGKTITDAAGNTHDQYTIFERIFNKAFSRKITDTTYEPSGVTDTANTLYDYNWMWPRLQNIPTGLELGNEIYYHMVNNQSYAYVNSSSYTYPNKYVGVIPLRNNTNVTQTRSMKFYISGDAAGTYSYGRVYTAGISHTNSRVASAGSAAHWWCDSTYTMTSDTQFGSTGLLNYTIPPDSTILIIVLAAPFNNTTASNYPMDTTAVLALETVNDYGPYDKEGKVTSDLRLLANIVKGQWQSPVDIWRHTPDYSVFAGLK